MATKSSLKQAYLVLNDKKYYKLIDVFNAICYISTQIKDTKENKNYFLIRSERSSVYNLYKILHAEFNYMNNRTTITNCLNRLIELNILKLNEEYKAWEIVGMENMFKNSETEKKTSGGYLKLRKFLFTEDFYNLPISDKKIVYMALCVMSSNNFKNIKLLEANILSEKSPWLRILNTTDPYYISEIFKRVLTKYDYFTDCSKEYRSKEINNLKRREKYIGYSKLKEAYIKLHFKFIFKPNYSLYNYISADSTLRNLKMSCCKFYNYINNTLDCCHDSVKDSFSDSLMLSMLSNTKYLNKNIKIELLDRIIIKLNTEVKISSPHNFINAILKTII